MISKDLPFDNRMMKFLYEKNQIRYLLLISPYNQNTVIKAFENDFPIIL